MPYLVIFSHIMAYLEPSLTLTSSEPCHEQNPGIFVTRDIFKTYIQGIFCHT